MRGVELSHHGGDCSFETFLRRYELDDPVLWDLARIVLSFVSITTAALARVDEEAAGLASGLLSTAVMLGGASGLAVLAAVASARSSDLLGSGSTPVAAEVGGLQLAFLVAAGVAFTASVVALVALQRGMAMAVAAPTTSA
jgi:hypothetical protein